MSGEISQHFKTTKVWPKKEKQRTSTGQSELAFSEKRLTRTKEQKRSMNACSMSEFWWGCKKLHQPIRNIIHKLPIMPPCIPPEKSITNIKIYYQLCEHCWQKLVSAQKWLHGLRGFFGIQCVSLLISRWTMEPLSMSLLHSQQQNILCIWREEA